MHLFGELRENFADLDAVGGGLYGVEFALGGTTWLRVPSVDMAHAATIPKEDYMFGLGGFGGSLGRQQVADGHAQQGSRSSCALQESAACYCVVLAMHGFFHLRLEFVMIV